MAIQIGQKAPDFTLRDSEKNPVTLSEQQGKNVILLFYPLAFTGVCTKELCNVRDNYNVYTDMNAEVYGISVDSLFVQGKFKGELGLNYTLLSDFNKDVSKAYDAFHETFGNDMLGVSKRAAFVIDKNGVVQYAEVLDNPGELPNFTAIQECLKELN